MFLTSVHHQEFFTVYTAMVYVIQVCWTWAHWGLNLIWRHISLKHRSLFAAIIDFIWDWFETSSILLLTLVRIPPIKSIIKILLLWHNIAVCAVKELLMMDRGIVRNIEFYSKNKFEKLVDLFGFSVVVHHDARSPERQKLVVKFTPWSLC